MFLLLSLSLWASFNVMCVFWVVLSNHHQGVTIVLCYYMSSLNYAGKNLRDVGLTYRCDLSNIMPYRFYCAFFNIMGSIIFPWVFNFKAWKHLEDSKVKISYFGGEGWRGFFFYSSIFNCFFKPECCGSTKEFFFFFFFWRIYLISTWYTWLFSLSSSLFLQALWWLLLVLVQFLSYLLMFLTFIVCFPFISACLDSLLFLMCYDAMIP